jgi:hypothetical protein
MKTSARRSFVNAAKEFEKIRDEAIASYPVAKRERVRLEILAYLHALGSEFRCALEAYREAKLGERPMRSPPWLLPDAPMALLHEYRTKLLDMAASAADASADGAEAAGPPVGVVREPKPGCELIDACDDMAWFQDRYLLAETFAEAAEATALPLEDSDDFYDEAARARMSEARHNRTLARMKDFAAQGEGDLGEIQRSTKAVERGRKRLDGWLEESKEAYQVAAEGSLKILAERLPGAFANDQEREHILSVVGDLDDPENRLRMKRWLTVSGLDPLSWTTNERRIPWQRWQPRRRPEGPGAASVTSSRRARSSWSWTRRRRYRRQPATWTCRSRSCAAGSSRPRRTAVAARLV